MLVLNAHPSIWPPAQIILDSGNPCAMTFFPTVDLKEVFHAVMAVLMSWISVQWPCQVPLSVALFYQSQAITLLRQRLAQGLHNDETYLCILCAMKTDVRSVTRHILQFADFLTKTRLSWVIERLSWLIGEVLKHCLEL